MTTRCQATAVLRRWNQSVKLPDVQVGQVFDCSDREAANLVAAGQAVLVDPATPITAVIPPHQARGIPGFATGTTNG